MSTKRKIKTRIQNKHAIEANWIKAVNFVPLQGEIIVYDIEVDNNGNILDLTGTNRTEPYTYERFKIGDGITKVNDLPFVMQDLEEYIRSKETIAIGLQQTVPENAIDSICDFKLVPTTQHVYYYSGNAIFRTTTENNLNGAEVPLATTKGNIVVKDKEDNIKYKKEIPQVINLHGISDEVNPTNITKRWSEKKYLTKEPILRENIGSGTKINIIMLYEFSEEEFADTGLPPKKADIPICSPGMYKFAMSSIENPGSHMWGGEIPRVNFYWDETNQKFYLKCRIHNGNSDPFVYTKVYFHYELETPKTNEDFYLALGLEAGDKIEFEQDNSEFDIYIQNNVLKADCYANVNVKEIDVTPTMNVQIPISLSNALSGFSTTATILNRGVAGKAVGGEEGDYSWIGNGKETNDYTSIIQNKINNLHDITGGGTVYLGSGTYTISDSLIIYDNIRIIGNGQTIIKQISNNTHALVLSGSNIAIRDLTIKLAGDCSEITSCIYVNSNNGKNVSTRDERYPENNYVWNCSVNNVFMSGRYDFRWEGNNQYLTEEMMAYRGVGIYSTRLFFNFFDCDGLFCQNLYSGIYGGGGSNNYRLYVIKSRNAVYDISGNNRYEIKGHTFYGFNENGSVTATDYVVYSDGEHNIFDASGFYDIQYSKACMYFSGLSMANICYVSGEMTEFTNQAMTQSHTAVIDQGRGNRVIKPYTDSKMVVGSKCFDITGLMSPNETISPTVDNALSGAGVWGNITSNIDWVNQGIDLSEVCRYPKDRMQATNAMASVVSSRAPSEDSPIEIIIDISNRPISSYQGLWIQFDHRYVAQDFKFSFDTQNDGTYLYESKVANNVKPIAYMLISQRSTIPVYRIKIVITKALKILDFKYQTAGYERLTMDYNTDELIGIVNIGMPQNDAYGRSFLGECGGSLYGNIDMHSNTLKNLAEPTDNADAATKEYVDNKIGGEVDGVEGYMWKQYSTKEKNIYVYNVEKTSIVDTYIYNTYANEEEFLSNQPSGTYTTSDNSMLEENGSIYDDDFNIDINLLINEQGQPFEYWSFVRKDSQTLTYTNTEESNEFYENGSEALDGIVTLIETKTERSKGKYEQVVINKDENHLPTNGYSEEDGNWYIKDTEDFITPELFGAKGDGKTDDTDAIQAAIDSGKPVKFLNNSYLISRTLQVVGVSGLKFSGKYLDGNNCTITTTANEPIFDLTLCGNVLSNFVLTFSSSVFNKTNNPYTSSIIRIRSYGKRRTYNEDGKLISTVEIGKNSGRHRFNNITVQSPLRWQDDAFSIHYGTAFQIIADGHDAYSYQNTFTACQADAMHTVIELTRILQPGEVSNGINGNQYDITAWNCDQYLKGTPGGSYFSGCVQSSHLKYDSEGNVLNEYLIDENGGRMGHNVFDTFFYDTASSSSSSKKNQKIIDIKGQSNNFTSYLPKESVEGEITKNEFRFDSSQNPNILLPVTGFGSYANNTTTIMPTTNSFSKIVTEDNHTVEFHNVVGYSYNSIDNYGIQNLKTYLPTKVDYLFGENSDGRGLYIIPKDYDNYMLITITNLEKFRFGNMFIQFGTNPKAPLQYCKLELTKKDGTTFEVKEQRLQDVRALVAFVGQSNSECVAMKIKISFGYDSTVALNTHVINKIFGVLNSSRNGLIDADFNTQKETYMATSQVESGRNALRLNNLSSIEHELVVKAYSKNLVNISTLTDSIRSNAANNFTYDIRNNNTIIMTNTTAGWNRWGFAIGKVNDLRGKTITISYDNFTIKNANGEDIPFDLYQTIYVHATSGKSGPMSPMDTKLIGYCSTKDNYITFTVDEAFDQEYVTVMFSTTTREPGDVTTYENIMIELGNKPSPYVAPLEDITQIEINQYKTNLIPSSVYTLDNWSSINSGYIYQLNKLQFEEAMLSVKSTGVLTGNLYFVFSHDNGSTWELSEGIYKLIDNGIIENQPIVAREDVLYGLWTDNLEILNNINKIFLEIGNKNTKYSDYIEPIAYHPESNGRVLGIKNTNGMSSMTLMSNINNIVIEAEYLTGNYREINASLTAAKAIADDKGNIISETYATKEEVGGASGGTAERLETARKISLSGAVEANEIEFDGSADKDIAISKIYESYLDWGGDKTNKTRSTPVDMAMKDQANIFAFMNPNLITIEYSRERDENNKSIWLDYEATNEEKINLVTKSNKLYCGKYQDGETVTTDWKLRVTIKSNGTYLYSYLEKILIDVNSSCRGHMEYSLNSAPDDFIVYDTTVSLVGPTWNTIYYPDYSIFGGTGSGYINSLRFTFYFNSGTKAPSISSIRAFGHYSMTVPSNMGNTGHLYDFDAGQNAIFPALVDATGLKENGTNISEIYATKEELNNLDIGGGISEGMSASKVSTSAMRIEGLSKVEHELEVNILTEEVQDKSIFNLTRYSKNLCDITKIEPRSSSYKVEVLDERTFKYTGNHYIYVPVVIPAGTEFTVSWGSIEAESGSNIVFRDIRLHYTDGTNTTQEYGKRTFVAEKDVYRLVMYKTSPSTSDVLTVRDFQIEIGNEVTSYELYIEPTVYTANEDGSVPGVMSISPTMSLLSNVGGIDIEAEYLTKQYTKVIDKHINNKINQALTPTE